MYHFNQDAALTKQLLFFCKKIELVVSDYTQVILVLALLLSLSLTACSQSSMQKKVGHNLIKSPSVNEEKAISTSNKINKPIDLSGTWKIGFRYQNKSSFGNMQIWQSQQNFSGQGKDEQNGATFKIEKGQVKGDEIIFLKRYDKQTDRAIQYHGRFSYLSSANGEIPYMGGDFSLEVNGDIVVGDWEAAMQVKTPPADVTLANDKKLNTSDKQPELQANSDEHLPDLSGKWSVAFESNFKTVHSTMFLEQDGHKITGHGIDLDTKEKFIIKKGWYVFPHLTIIRQYQIRSAGKSQLTFKAEVSEISDQDYVGPYLSGKTQGGGEWEAERVN